MMEPAQVRGPAFVAAQQFHRPQREPETTDTQISFGDVLHGWKTLPLRPDRIQTSPQQMLRQPPTTAGERRMAERINEYRAHANEKAELRNDARRRRDSTPTQPESTGAESRHWTRTSPPPPKLDSSAWNGAHSTKPAWPPLPPPDANSGEQNLNMRPAPQRGAASPPSIATKSAPTANHAMTMVHAATVTARSAHSPAAEVARALASATNARSDAATPSNGAAQTTTTRAAGINLQRPDAGRPDERLTRTPSSIQRQSQSAASKFEQLVRAVRLSSGRTSTARVMLAPPELGRVHVRVMVHGDRVDIGVTTEHEAARKLVAERAHSLRHVLEQQGLAVERLEITTNNGPLFASPGPTQGEGARRHDPESEGESRRRQRSVRRPELGDSWPIDSPGLRNEYEFAAFDVSG
jgi:flagellar hook-length control protein FliK